MTFAQRGMYLEMLLEQWENLSLPDSPEACADLIGGTGSEWGRNWTVLRRNFTLDEATGRIQNLRLEDERAKQRERSQQASDKGKVGAAARWKTGVKSRVTHGTGMPQPSHGDSTGSSENGFPLPIATPIAIATATAEVPPTEVSVVPLRDTSPAVLTFPCVGNGPKSWALTSQQIAEWETSYPGIDVLGECRRALEWVKANHAKTARGMPAFLVNWLNRTVNRRGGTSVGPQAIDSNGLTPRSNNVLRGLGRK